MKNYLFVLVILFASPMASFGQMHSSIDLVAGYDFLNKFSGGVVLPTGLLRPPASIPGYRFGLNVNVRLFHNIVFKTGARYAKYSYAPYGNVFDFPYEDVGFVDFFYENHHEYYIEVPLAFRYELLKKKWGVFVEFGVLPHLYWKGKREEIHDRYHFEPNNVKYTDPENPISKEITDFEVPYLRNTNIRLAYVLGIGLNYSWNRSYQFFLQPTCRYLSKIEERLTPVNLLTVGSNLNFGVEVGIRRAILFEKYTYSDL